MWVNQNFLLQEDVNPEADGISLSFLSLRGSGPFHFRMDNSGQVGAGIFFKKSEFCHYWTCLRRDKAVLVLKVVGAATFR